MPPSTRASRKEATTDTPRSSGNWSQGSCCIDDMRRPSRSGTKRKADQRELLPILTQWMSSLEVQDLRRNQPFVASDEVDPVQQSGMLREVEIG